MKRRHCIFRNILATLAILAASLAAHAQTPGARRQPPTPHVLIIGIDTMRGDHLGCAGNDWIRTPEMDALASDGVVFTRCFSTAPWTLPSFASIFTGLLPYRHGAVGGDYSRLGADHNTLTEFFASAGYNTSGYVSIDYLTDPFGMAQGYVGGAPPGLDPDLDRASRITWLGLETLRTVDLNRPQFLFLHYFDVHAPYDPPAPYTRMYYDGDEKAGPTPVHDMLLSDANRARNKDSGVYDWLEGITDLEFGVKEYAAGVSYVDDHVGQLTAYLKEQGLFDDMMIILVSDHGEHLGDHDIWFTHTEPWQETLHVPLLIKFPNNAFAGTVVDAPVSTMDIMPTVIDAMMVRPPAVDGRSLLPLCAGQVGTVGSLLVAEQGSDPGDWMKAFIDWPWKLIATHRGEETTYALYNLNDDPGETIDLATTHEAKAKRMTRRLWRIFDPENPVVEAGTALSAEIDEATRRRLEALGY